MFCLKCGSVVEDGMKFCSKCGTKVGSVSDGEPVKREPGTTQQITAASKIERQGEVHPKLSKIPEGKKAKKKTMVKKEPPAAPKGEKSILPRLAVGAGILAALALCIFIGGHFLTKAMEASSQAKTVNQIVTDLAEGDYEAAVELYEDNYKYNETPEELITQLRERLSTLWTTFSEGSVSYTQVMKEMDAFQKMDVSDLDTDVEELLGNIESLNASRTAYSTADALVAEGDYVGAIQQYDLVIESDSNYSAALTKREEAVNAYRQSVLEEAEEYAAGEDYTAALAALNSGLENLPNDTALTEQMTVYTGKQEEQNKQSYITRAKQYGDDEDFLKAVQTLQQALEEYPGNAEMTSLLSDYQDRYVENTLEFARIQLSEGSFSAARSTINTALDALGSDVKELEEYLEIINAEEQNFIDAEIESYIASAETFVQEKDYDSAISVIQEALQVYGDSEKLQEKLAELEEKKPVMLSELTIAESSDFFLATGELLQDTVGNYYSGTSTYELSYRSGYATIYIGGDYKTISGLLACLNNTDSGVEGVVSIYGDDKLLYTSSAISRISLPQEFEVNISGVEWLTIRFSSNDYDFCAVLFNCALEKN